MGGGTGAAPAPLTGRPAGSKGNLCQRKVPLSVSLALTVPAAVMAAYYLLLQTYALRLEAILSAILLLFYAAELLLGVLALLSFSRYCAGRGRRRGAACCRVLTHPASFAVLMCIEALHQRTRGTGTRDSSEPAAPARLPGPRWHPWAA